MDAERPWPLVGVPTGGILEPPTGEGRDAVGTFACGSTAEKFNDVEDFLNPDESDV
jgi:hypothetical protein